MSETENNIKERAERYAAELKGQHDEFVIGAEVGYIKGATDMINQWVSVETPPEDEQWVLVSRNGDVMLMSYQYQHGKYTPYGYPWPDEDVTHWQPLPEPPPLF